MTGRHVGIAAVGRHRVEPRPSHLAAWRRARTPRVAGGVPRRPLLVVTVIALAGVFLGADTGWAHWTALASGRGTAATGTLTPPATVTATVTQDPTTVAVTWTASIAPDGAPQGYYVSRVEASTYTTAPACGTSPLAPTTDLTCQDQPESDGDYYYVVTGIHHSWTATSSDSNTVTVDTVAPPAPSVPQLTAASDSGISSSDRVTNDSTPTFTGTAESGSTVTLSIGGVAAGAGPAIAGAYSITPASVLADGVHTVTATASDAAGNTGATSQATSVSIDTAPPAVTVSQHAQQADPTNSEPVTFDIIFSEPVTGLTAEDVNLTAPAGATMLITGTGTSYTLAVSGMTSDGTVTVAVAAHAAVDSAGNGNTASTSPDDSVTHDTTAPAAPTAPVLEAASDSGTSDSDHITNVTTPTVTGTTEAGASVTVYDAGVAVGTAVASSGTYAVTTTALTEGNHTLTATATDAAGNTSPTSTGTTVTIDLTAPAAPPAPDLTAASDSWSPSAADTSDTDNITHVTTPTFTGSVETNTTVTLYSDGDAVGTAVATTTDYTITTTPRTDGIHGFTAMATDLAGNTSPSSAGLTVTIDSATPLVTIDAVSYNNGRVTSSGTAGIATGDADTVQVVICTQDDFPCTAANTLHAGTPTIASTGTWAYTSTNLQTCTLLLICSGPGQVYLQATQTDHAGNNATSNTESRNYP